MGITSIVSIGLIILCYAALAYGIANAVNTDYTVDLDNEDIGE